MNKELGRYLRGERTPSKYRVREIVSEFPQLNPILEEEVMREDLVFSQVKIVEKGRTYTVDIETDSHEFVANGIVVHNKRRGANMGVLRVDHPDIMDFITAKEDQNKFTNFNFSVAITDTFMEAAKTGSDYDLIDPSTNSVVGSLNAAKVFEKIIDLAWHNGEPGVLFIDAANRSNPTPQLGEFESTNPCGEQFLLPYEACLTGNSLITTPHGTRKLRDMITSDAPSLVIGTDYKAHKYNKVISKGYKKVIELTLSNGSVIICTPDHKIELTDGSFCCAEETIGKNVRVLTGGPCYTIVDERSILHEMLGWIHGDGWYSDTLGISFNNKDGDFEFKDLILSKFIEVFKVTTQPMRDNDDSYQHQTDKKESKDIAASFGMVCGQHYQKEFPTSFFEWNDYEQRSFIRGLFSADAGIGGRAKTQIHFATSSKKLCCQVIAYLNSIGIHTNKYTTSFSSNRRDQYRVTITKNSANIFINTIGFIGSQKTGRFNESSYADEESYKVTSISESSEEEVYDIVEVSNVNTFFANGIGVHNCNLGSINLGLYVNKGKIDFIRLGKTVKTAVRFLDNVIDCNRFPIPEIAEMTQKTRKIGLGVMGLHDMLIQLELPYGEKEGRKAASEVMGFIREQAEITSIELAESKGAFPAYDPEINTYPSRRNAALTSIQPTGTVSMIADCASGCEPYFSVVMEKNVMDGDRFLMVNKHFEAVARKEGFFSDTLMKKVAQTGTVVGHEEIPEKWQNIFRTAQDIAPEEHIRMQGALQQNGVDSSISKTINLPSSATKEDVRLSYLLGFELGCKGLTVYRDGSRDAQVLNTVSSDKEKTATVSSQGLFHKKELPDVLSAKRYRLKDANGNTIYIIVCFGETETPMEVFAKFPFDNRVDLKDKSTMWTTTCRLVSLALRYQIPMEEIIKQLDRSSGHMLDLPAQLGKLLKSFMAGTRNGFSSSCPECPGVLIFEEGCEVCRECGYSKCS
ncbi:MAG: hypothetical protein D3905_08560 [Candidatus Electrothrix sp. AS4_5]|nr:hypothetical protein [Candidatus Electrothrix gigas]